MVFLFAMLLFDPQSPSIRQEGIVDAASHRPASAGGRIAPGTVVAIHGVLFASASRRNQVLLRVRGREVQLPVLSSSGQLLEAWLPLDTPLGVGLVTVTSDGRKSAAAQVEIQQDALGLYSANGQGWGTAAPGEPGALLATGSARATEIFVGGRRAKVRRITALRSRQNRIEIELPPAVPEGCSVPVYGVSGKAVSNTVMMAIGRSAGDCTKRVNTGRGAWMLVVRSVRGDEFSKDEAYAIFTHVKPDSRAGKETFFNVPRGTCSTFAQQATPETVALSMVGLATRSWEGEPFDPGGNVSINNGRTQAQLGQVMSAGGYYRRELSGRDSPLTLDAPTFMTAVGLDPVRLPAPAPFTATEFSGWRTLVPGRDLRLSWHGAKGDVVQVLLSSASPSGAAGMTFCLANATADQFTIPAALLAHLPRGRGTLTLASWNRGEVPPLPKQFDFLNAFTVFLREVEVIIP